MSGQIKRGKKTNRDEGEGLESGPVLEKLDLEYLSGD